MREYQYKFYTLTILDDGTSYLSSKGTNGTNDEVTIRYDENGDEYININRERIYLNEMEEINY